jgi:hypothetical protein
MNSKSFSEGNPGRLKKSDWILIGCSWLLVQLFILKFHGINDKEESIKYISLADQWIKGARNFSSYNLFYSGYISIHVLLRSLGLPHKSMYAVQLLFSLLAAYYYIKILCLVLHSRFAIVISALLYATCFIIQQWVSILFTDSIFSSLLIIATYFLLAEQKSTGNKWVCWILLISLTFFRPVGFLFIPVACFHWIMGSRSNNIRRLLIFSVILLFIGTIIYKSFEQSDSYYYPIHSLHNIQANVICGYPGDLLKFRKVPYQEGMSVFNYLFHNPGMTARLILARIYKVFSMGRPYFSPVHNLLLFAATFIYYILALIGAIEIIRKKERELYFLIAGILIFSFPLIIFCIEWSGRFSLPVICYVLLMGAIGTERIFLSTRSFRIKS